MLPRSESLMIGRWPSCLRGIAVLTCCTCLLMLSSCDPSTEVPAGNTTAVVDTPADQAGNTVCDPFSNDPNHVGSNQDMGAVGHLFYLDDSMPRYTQVSDYMNNGIPLDATLFMDQIYIPTRMFDLGFVTQSGELLKNQDGNNLYEYFALRLESELRLGDTDAPGAYQFALLSDDGANLYVDSGSGLQQVVNNDGTHPTRMGCSTAPVNLDLTSSLPMKVEYYQGPRYHIALTVLWRPWPTNPNDPLCGTSGNSWFFDPSTVPSTPTSNFNALLTRGWKVLNAQNYALPRSVESNPCTQAQPVRTFITATTPAATATNSTSFSATFNSNFTPATFECSLDGATRAACTSPFNASALATGNHSFQVWAKDSTGRWDDTGATFNWLIDTTPPGTTGIALTSTSTSVTMTWTTSEPATSQLQWGPTTALANTTVEDTTLVTQHSVTVTGLTPGTPYFFKATGKDQAGNVYLSGRFGKATTP